MSLPMIDPILPQLRREVPDGKEWRYEVKLDGFRGVLYIDGPRAWFRSKTGNVMTRFQELADEIRATVKVRSAIFDGEIVVLRDGLPDFDALFRRNAEPEYSAFDLLWLNGTDLRSLVYLKRKARLRRLIAPTLIGYVEDFADSQLFAATRELDLEGVVAKGAADAYVPTTRWIKVKHDRYSQAVGRGDLFHRK
jgi:bifunctional non-homologous end joining protein LigD